MRILHITAHMGGGAGNAISTIIINDTQDMQRLISLQCSEKRQYVEKCKECGAKVWENPDNNSIVEQLKWADVVILHWWHHPLTYEFLINLSGKIPIRMVLWAHISGCCYPVLREQFALKFDQIFFTTPYSFENTEWSEQGREHIKNKASVVYGIGQLDSGIFRQKRHIKKEKFVIGYVGTLEKSKLHPEYVEFCVEISKRISDCLFLMVGDNERADWLIKEIKEREMEDRFQFTGYRNDVSSEFKKMDVFAYPLNPKHFGTTENVILEAMLSGLPVILLDQNTEKYIIKNGENGYLVRTKEEYAKVIYELYCDADKRNRIGDAARQYVEKQYRIDKNVLSFRVGLLRVMSEPKHVFHFRRLCGDTPHEWMLSGMGKEMRQIFWGSSKNQSEFIGYLQKEAENLCGQSKSSIGQFASFYPSDRRLEYWKHLMGEMKSEEQ